MVRNDDDESRDPLLFGDPADRELVDLVTAAALAGETPQAFLTGVSTNLYPKPHRWREPGKQWVWQAGGRWKHEARWRRGLVLAAVAERDRKSPFRK